MRKILVFAFLGLFLSLALILARGVDFRVLAARNVDQLRGVVPDEDLAELKLMEDKFQFVCLSEFARGSIIDKATALKEVVKMRDKVLSHTSSRNRLRWECKDHGRICLLGY